jgi:hypothetical protein
VHRALVIAGALGLSGCVLHFSDDTSCGDDVAPPPAGGLLINPATLQCERFSEAQECATFDPNLPTWGSCESSCFQNPEAACVNSIGCRAAYDHDCMFGTGPCTALTAYIGCFPLDQNPDFITGCGGLDAWNCSRHDQCFATYRPGGAQCRDGIDQDGDGTADDSDECSFGYVRCFSEVAPI